MKLNEFARIAALSAPLLLGACDQPQSANKLPEELGAREHAPTEEIDKQKHFTREQIIVLIGLFKSDDGSPNEYDTEWILAKRAIDFAKKQGVDTTEMENRMTAAIANKVTEAVGFFESLDGSPNEYDTEWILAKRAIDFAKKQGLDTTEMENRMTAAIANKVTEAVGLFESDDGSPNEYDTEWILAKRAIDFAKKQGLDTTEMEKKLAKVWTAKEGS